MSDLIKRVESARGPDAELDTAIVVALGLENECPFWLHSRYRTTPMRITGSLDDAVSLCERVLPGHFWGINSNKGIIGESIAWVAEIYTSEPAIEAKAHSPALALVLAILRAHPDGGSDA